MKKTVIIDRSLSGMRLYSQAGKKEIYSYACALFECGVDYIEVDFTTLQKLCAPKRNENYIFRLKEKSEIQLLEAFERVGLEPFKYVVVPLKFSYLIPQINIPVLLELNIGDVDLFSYLKVVSDNIDLTKVSLLRLVGEFGENFNMKAFLEEYNLRYTIPVDICATNNSMLALSTTIAANFAKADSITLSFGESDNFAALEEFLIVMATSYKHVVKDTFVTGVCRASIICALISDIKCSSMQAIINLYRLTPKKIKRIDQPPKNDETIRNVVYSSLPGYQTVIEKGLESLDVNDEVADEIMNIMDTLNISPKPIGERRHFLN
ncbi:MAG: hypothetical protein FWH05_07655 [Oscillospiraceae bacterium]|nr:hypothetical protein [Oscillospiraceae bacterium]